MTLSKKKKKEKEKEKNKKQDVSKVALYNYCVK